MRVLANPEALDATWVQPELTPEGQEALCISCEVTFRHVTRLQRKAPDSADTENEVMIPLPSGIKIWLVAGITDMRNGLNGLGCKKADCVER